MGTRIDDTREFDAMSVEEADSLFQTIAIKETEIKKHNAICDKKIAVLKLNLENTIAPLRNDIAELSKRL